MIIPPLFFNALTIHFDNNCTAWAVLVKQINYSTSGSLIPHVKVLNPSLSFASNYEPNDFPIT